MIAPAVNVEITGSLSIYAGVVQSRRFHGNAGAQPTALHGRVRQDEQVSACQAHTHPHMDHQTLEGAVCGEVSLPRDFP